MGLHDDRPPRSYDDVYRRRTREIEARGHRLMVRTAWWLLKAFAVLWLLVMVVGILAGPQH